MLHLPYIIPTPQDLQAAWKGLEAAKASGKARSIGVSNMQKSHLDIILETATVIPAINQLEYHPYLQRANGFVSWMKKRGIEVSSFKGLAPLTVAKGGPLDKLLISIAQSHGVTEEAVLLRWAFGQGLVAVTTTRNEERIDRYLTALDFKLTPEEHDQITQVGLTHHFCWWGRKYFDPDDRS